MFIKSLGLMLTVFFSLESRAVSHGIFYKKQSLLMRSSEPNVQSMKLRPDGTMRSETIELFNQKLDHRSPSSPTFKQRLFIDSHFAEGPDAPVFYIICGEWNCAGTASYNFVTRMAQSMKAHLVALEHRFYGESLPVKKLTPQVLRYLDLESAIEDLAVVQRTLMQKKGMTGKWIAVGGSYAGTLAAFYRLKHPELVAGSLASSAPVLMKNEFREYDGHIAKVINKTMCGDKVREAVTLIEKKLSTPEANKEVKTLFNATKLTNDEDFLYVVADMLAAAVQYGRDKVFCDALTSTSDLVQGYARGGLTVLNAMGASPFDISLAIAEKEEVTADDNMRQWLYQSCRQFGWFQVANGIGRSTSRSQRVDLNYHDNICKRFYKISMGRDGALNPNWYQKLFTTNSSNIIFTNGSNDPWLTLSVIPRSSFRNPEFDLFMMDGAAHCNDLRISQIPSVSQAQASIEKIVALWVR